MSPFLSMKDRSRVLMPPPPLSSSSSRSYSVEPLRSALVSSPAPPASADPGSKLMRATKELFADMGRGGVPFPPIGFLYSLRCVRLGEPPED